MTTPGQTAPQAAPQRPKLNFEQALERFVEYQREHGGSPLVPTRYVCPDGYRLGHTIDWWRGRHHPDSQGRRLPAYQNDALNAANMIWRQRDYVAAEAVADLKVLRVACPGEWRRRAEHNGLAARIRHLLRYLTPDDRARLDEIGFVMAGPRETAAREAYFRDLLDALVEHRRAGGRWPPLQTTPLGSRFRGLVRQARAGTVTADRRDQYEGAMGDPLPLASSLAHGGGR